MLQQAVAAIEARNITVQVVNTGEEATQAVLDLLPAGADVMTGGSTTLRQIGLIEALEKGNYAYRRPAVFAEPDPARRQQLRRQSLLADYFLGSVNAIAATGELVAADQTGSRVGGYVYPAGKVILVASAHKIVPDLAAAIDRVRNVVLPLEDQRMKATGASGTRVGKLVVIEYEAIRGRMHLILIKEGRYGF